MKACAAPHSHARMPSSPHSRLCAVIARPGACIARFPTEGEACCPMRCLMHPCLHAPHAGEQRLHKRRERHAHHCGGYPRIACKGPG